MKTKFLSEKKTLLFLLVSFSLIFFFLSYFSEATYDSGDGIKHYLISRYSWKHNNLFLDSWGKPFFTIVSSPFSQFGLLGMNIFNILCGIGSAFFAYKIAKKLKLNYSLLVIPFLLFTPCYFPTINSGLTEPFFGFILISSVYLMFVNRYFWACVLVSFLPFVRADGNMILPLFFIILIYRRKILLSPLLAFGTFIYSIIGYFYYNDFFWIINQNVYNGANSDIYGSGGLFHFVANHNFIWGTTLGLLFIVGLIAIIFYGVRTIKNKETKKSQLPEELFLIYGSFTIYFVAHSIVYWIGFNSLGLLLVIAGIIPCSALICLRGLNFIMNPFFKEKKILEFIIIGIILFLVIRSPFKHDYFPYKLGQEETVIKEAGDWFKKSQLTHQKVYYLYPFLADMLNLDSFNPDKVVELWGLYPAIKEWGISVVPDSSIIFWDAHFGPNECRIPLNTIMNDPNFELIKSFKPKTVFTTLGGYPFEVNVFMKLNHPKKLDTLSFDSFDFETYNPLLQNVESIIPAKAFSGENLCKLSSGTEYSVTVKKRISDIPKNTLKIEFNSKILDIANNSKDARIVLSVNDDKDKNLFWSEVPLLSKSINNVNTKWKNVSAEFILNLNSFPPNAYLKLYVWNKFKKEFYLDDFEIIYIGKK